ncbi:MAG: ATP-binding protein [Bacteroidales bacterium]|jgi:signal transduction histidine kinase
MEKFFLTVKNRVIGNDSEFQFEHRLLNTITAGVAITTLIGFMINILVRSSMVEMVTTISTSVFFFLIYLLSRISGKFKPAMWLAIISSYGLLSFLWINSAGSRGPVPYAFFLLFLSITLLTEKRQRLLLLFVMVINMMLLFYIENRYSHILHEYKTESSRMTDMAISIILYYTLGGIMIILARNNYIKEKQNAQKSDKMKSAFLANMSHEIRTPMNAIMGFTGLLKNDDLSPEKKEKYSQIVDESAAYLLRLINDILDISKIEANELVIIYKTFDLNELMKTIELSHIRLLSEAKKGKVDFYYEDNHQQKLITSDATRLSQVLTNLISNAIKCTWEGYVKFGYTYKPGEFLFYVKDSGIGIKKEDEKCIFERFTKVNDNINVSNRGTGIGLSISKKIVELLHGRIWFESSVGEGSGFYFTLPENRPDDLNIPQANALK